MKLPSLLHPRSLGLSSSALLRAFIERIVEFLCISWVFPRAFGSCFFRSPTNSLIVARWFPAIFPAGLSPFSKGKPWERSWPQVSFSFHLLFVPFSSAFDLALPCAFWHKWPVRSSMAPKWIFSNVTEPWIHFVALMRLILCDIVQSPRIPLTSPDTFFLKFPSNSGGSRQIYMRSVVNSEGLSPKGFWHPSLSVGYLCFSLTPCVPSCIFS